VKIKSKIKSQSKSAQAERRRLRRELFPLAPPWEGAGLAGTLMHARRSTPLGLTICACASEAAILCTPH